MLRSLFAKLPFFAIAAFFGALVGAGNAFAASSDWNVTDHTRVRLISAQDTTGSDQTLTLGLQFELNKDWKIYWRSAGDAGYPPSVDWKGSSNFSEAQMRWPLPVRFSILGFETLGYKKEVVYPIQLKLANPGRAVSLTANVDYLACAELCIPYEATLRLDLPAGAATSSTEAHLINRYEARVPGSGERAGLDIESVEVKSMGTTGNKATLIVSAKTDGAFMAPDLFVEGPDVLSFAKPRIWIDNGGTLAVLEVSVDGLGALKRPLSQTDLTLTLADDPRAAEFIRRPTPATPDTLAISDLMDTTAPDGRSFAMILVLALLGGLILNLMPCVLPVLSIKLMGVIGHGGGDKTQVRYSFIASAAGIIVSFLALAGALVALKLSGAAIGWGIQFQQPWFLILMALVVSVFAANMWGFFEVHLPQTIAEIGEQTTHQHGLGNHFLTGALATLLATPCSAPFLGTAVGFAMARGPVDIFAVFTALGVGLAAPYLAVAAWPGLATRMPKPGPWMITLRRVLGVALIATAAWLVSILGFQVSELAAWLVGGILVGVMAIFWLHKRMGRRFGKLEWVAVAVLATAALLVPDTTRNGNDLNPNLAELEGIWQPFDEAAIPALVASGKTVFVDVTAEWCITCQVNKAISLSQGKALEALKAGNVIAMQADWTRPSDEISDYLARFGRYGIPFNAVYGPKQPHGKALPELLSQSIVIEALQSAGASGAGTTAASDR